MFCDGCCNFYKGPEVGDIQGRGEVTCAMLKGGSMLHVNAIRGETTLDGGFHRLPNERMLRWAGNE